MITKEQIEDWLGSNNTKDEAIDVIYKIINEGYSIKLLTQEVETY